MENEENSANESPDRAAVTSEDAKIKALDDRLQELAFVPGAYVVGRP